MPSFKFASALLYLGCDNNAPWTWPTWMAWVNTSEAPFFEGAVFEDLSADEVAQIGAYARALWNLRDPVAFSQRTADNDNAGRQAWGKWVDAHWGKWKIAEMVVKLISRAGRDLLTVMRKMSTNTFPTMKMCQVFTSYDSITATLFGPDGFLDPDSPTPFIKDTVRQFIDALMATIWGNWRKSYKCDKPKMKGDVESIARMEEHKAKVLAMQDTLQGTVTIAAERLPKVLHEALKLLATTQDVNTLMSAIAEHIQRLSAEESSEPLPDVDLDPAQAVEWSEGVEEYQHLSEDNLYNMLGLPEHKILYFNDKYDPKGVHSGGLPEEEEWFKTNG
ncbi:hypothetical protein BV25DRAFT_1920728 [Artomyces pyxidatus]|uniref:Uncharacterized protein n=1 Tax=Artomyces pyxidatus TaxID=48021 RepID=A0ACB8SKR1_9AGAM|nr:hypothetical protein BV25DRAFT_1920728 [Artomyces pyxidatus]